MATALGFLDSSTIRNDVPPCLNEHRLESRLHALHRRAQRVRTSRLRRNVLVIRLANHIDAMGIDLSTRTIAISTGLAANR